VFLTNSSSHHGKSYYSVCAAIVADSRTLAASHKPDNLAVTERSARRSLAAQWARGLAPAIAPSGSEDPIPTVRCASAAQRQSRLAKHVCENVAARLARIGLDHQGSCGQDRVDARKDLKLLNRLWCRSPELSPTSSKEVDSFLSNPP
jgi:hypothetical protein